MKERPETPTGAPPAISFSSETLTLPFYSKIYNTTKSESRIQTNNNLILLGFFGGAGGGFNWRKSLRLTRQKDVIFVRVDISSNKWWVRGLGLRMGPYKVGLVDVVDNGGAGEQGGDDDDNGPAERGGSGGRSASAEFFAVHYSASKQSKSFGDGGEVFFINY